MLTNNSLPPQNIEAEESILGGILLDPAAMGRVCDLMLPEAFYVKAHRDIYEAALKLHGQGQPTDLMTVTSWLQDHHLLEKVGGISKLAQLVDRTVSAVNIDRYADLVMDKYVRRQLITAGHEIVDLGYDTTQTLETVLDESEKKIFRLSQKRPQEGLIHISDSLIKTYSDIEKLYQKTATPGIETGFYDLDAITTGLQRSDLIIVAGRPSMGKCLAATSEIVLEDGSLVTIEEIYRSRQGRILTLQNNWKFALTKPSNFVDDGIKPVFRLTTKLGKTIETTITHPFLTIQGWQKLSELKPGDKIAVPRQINIFGREIIADYQVKLLAYLIGDGCLTNTSPQFTNNNPLLQEDFIESVNQFPGVKVRRETSRDTRTPTIYVTSDYEITVLSKNSKNAVTLWLENIGLWGKKSHSKTIPAIIFRLDRPLIALFLNRLFATDGWLSVLKSGQVQLGYATVSKKLAEQIQHLLLRFGVISNLKKGSVTYKDCHRQAWQIDITDAKSIKIFIETIKIFGKEKAIDLVKEALANKRYQTNCDLIPREVWQKIALDNLSLQQLSNSEVYWDEIISIEYIDDRQVYDLTIPETHNFVANDICVHNTSFALNIAHNIAKYQKLSVAIFSLEMSKEQLAFRLLASEAEIESNKLRSGRVVQQQSESLTVALGNLVSLPIYIDDATNISVMQMRSQVRRLQAEYKQKLGLVLIDYLQLMEGSGTDNRVQELSRITRALKGLAREAEVPVMALSQLSRGVESRTNKRPMMSDLRESGCLTGDTQIILADNGKQVPLRSLIGRLDFKVWALNETSLTLEAVTVSNAFATGVKPVYRLTTRLGRTIRATSNHKFRTFTGWQRLDSLTVGDRLVLARTIPSPTTQTEYLLVQSDIYWDEIVSIEPDGEEEVFDLTVPVHHNFLANNIVVHNSIEQDADLVIMLYRDEYYNPDSPDHNIAEVIVTKHRNGPTGTIKLIFKPEFTQFRNLQKRQEY